MLTYDIIQQAGVLADKLQESGLLIRPIPGTPVEVLNSTSHATHFKMMTDSVSQDPNALAPSFDLALEKASSYRDDSGVCLHDVVYAEQVKAGSAVATRLLAFTRNEVNGTISSIVSDVQRRIEELSERELSPFTVVESNYAAIWESPALDSLIERFRSVEPAKLEWPKFMPELGETAELSIIQTGNSILDEDIAKMLEHRGAGFIAKVYNDYLARDFSAYPDPSLLNPYTGDRDVILTLFLIASFFNAKEEVPVGIVDLPLEKYRLYFATLRHELGRLVNSVISDRVRKQQSKRLVISYPAAKIHERSNNRNILVNGDLYAQWKEAGGTDAAILGAYASGENPSYIDDFEGKVARYEKLWGFHQRTVEVEVRDNLTTRALEAILGAVSGYIASAAEESLPKVGKATLQKLAQTHVAALSERDVKDIYKATRQVVCRTLYAHTDAEQFLTLMDIEGEANPGIAPNEAALLAFMEYIVRWVAQQGEAVPV